MVELHIVSLLLIGYTFCFVSFCKFLSVKLSSFTLLWKALHLGPREDKEVEGHFTSLLIKEVQ